jgi:hypothetical protein
MTKVILSESVLCYRREMAEIVSETIKASFIEGVRPFRSSGPTLAQPDLLPSPKIEVIEPTCYKGKIGDFIFLATSADYGIGNLHVVIRDDKGNVIEGGNAAPFADCPDCWDYVTAVSVPSGTRVTISAAATDHLWGIGAATTVVTIP